jgi:uncharacterized protein (TIGR00369 family)
MPHLVFMPRHERIHGHTEKQVQLSNNCFGCGPGNEAGLQLKFTLDRERERFICRFRLAPRFVGPPGHAHGGIIATILDEAMGKVNKLHGVTALTAKMEIKYIKPVPLGKPLTVEGWEVSKSGREHIYAGEIRNKDGVVLAVSTGKFVEIDPHQVFAKFLKKKHSDAT